MGSKNTYQLKDFVWSSHTIIGQQAKASRYGNILDVACGLSGSLAGTLRRNQKLLGIDKIRIENPPKAYNKIMELDIEKNSLKYFKGTKFGLIILADTLEHIKDPSKVINKIKGILTSGGTLLISVPNMDFCIAKLLRTININPKMERGLFDRTHLHNFTINSLKYILEKNGLQITNRLYTPPPLPLLSTFFDKGRGLFFLYKILNYLANKLPSIFAYQIIIEAKVKK